MRCLLIVACVAWLSGCASESLKTLDDGTMELGWSEPFSGSPAKASLLLNDRLYGLCPSGYRKLDEWATGDRQSRWYYWKVKCLDGPEDGRK